MCAKKYLKNSYICSSDNYFIKNPFEKEVKESYYSCVFAPSYTQEWGVELDKNDKIISSHPQGFNQWYIIGHAFWDENFSKNFIEILENSYNDKKIYKKLWDEVYLDNIDKLTLKIKRYPQNYIFEFDTLDELREFDSSYIKNTNSNLIKKICTLLNTQEEKISKCAPNKEKTGFYFEFNKEKYEFKIENEEIIKLK